MAGIRDLRSSNGNTASHRYGVIFNANCRVLPCNLNAKMNKNSDAEERVMSAVEAEFLQSARAEGYFIYRPVGSAAAPQSSAGRSLSDLLSSFKKNVFSPAQTSSSRHSPAQLSSVQSSPARLNSSCQPPRAGPGT